MLAGTSGAAIALARRGGWGDTVRMRADRPATDVLTGRRIDAGPVRLADLLDTYPVALLMEER